MAFDVVPLGTAGTHTGPGRPCSGYLVRHEDTRVLVDAGNGSTSNLLSYVDFHDLDAVVITHRHLDHCVDLVGMFYALRFGGPEPRRVRLHAAPEVLGLMRTLLDGDSKFTFADAFDHHEFRSGEHLEIGGIAIDASTSIHPVPTLTLDIRADGRRLVYSSDSAGGDPLVEAARGADVLLCEATWQGDAADFPPGIHLTAHDAALVAEKADVDRLVLTHVLGSLDRATSVAQAVEIRPHVTAAVEHEVIVV